MERAARAGGLKRKCQHLADYATAQNLPYSGVLSWFDRNRKKLLSVGEMGDGAPVPGPPREGGIMITGIPGSDDPNAEAVPMHDG